MYTTAYENIYQHIYMNHYIHNDSLEERACIKIILNDIQRMIDEEYELHNEFFEKVGLDD
jgi:hypothetical protein